MKRLSQYHNPFSSPTSYEGIKQVEQVMDFIYFEDSLGRVWRVYMGGDQYPSIQLVDQ